MLLLLTHCPPKAEDASDQYYDRKFVSPSQLQSNSAHDWQFFICRVWGWQTFKIPRAKYLTKREGELNTRCWQAQYPRHDLPLLQT
eukprot:6475252-Amphidinium_carterae.1